MSNYMDISEIRQAWDNGEYYVKMDIPQKVAVDHVFDVDLSVRRNREMAEEWNQNVTNLQNEKWRKQAELSKKLTEDVIIYSCFAFPHSATIESINSITFWFTS